MISFVWSSKYPFIAGSGGSETYTAGQIRELLKRGIDARIITIGHGDQDGRDDFPDIPFYSIESKEELSKLDDLLVYVTYPLEVATKHQPYAILHCPPPTFAHGDPLYVRRAFNGVRLITASKFAAGIWRRYLKASFGRMPTVYPFADNAFTTVKRPKYSADKPARILYAGRLNTDKGIYTLLASLHMENLLDVPYKLTVTTAGSNTEEGKIILNMLKANPLVHVVPARRTAKEMSKLFAEHDIVVMPSTNIFWQELFGMISIEAQHAGCRVVASRSGGLPETNLGGLMLVRPDDPQSLAKGLEAAIAKGALSPRERSAACKQFNVAHSVDSLLKAINHDRYMRITRQGHKDPSLTPTRTISTLRRTLQPRGAAGLTSMSGLLKTELNLRAMLHPVAQPAVDASTQSGARARSRQLDK